MEIQKTSKELEVERYNRERAKWANRKARWTTWRIQQNATNNGRMSFTVAIDTNGHSHDMD